MGGSKVVDRLGDDREEDLDLAGGRPEVDGMTEGVEAEGSTGNLGGLVAGPAESPLFVIPELLGDGIVLRASGGAVVSKEYADPVVIDEGEAIPAGPFGWAAILRPAEPMDVARMAKLVRRGGPIILGGGLAGGRSGKWPTP